jgi:hypothetical protein
MIPGGVAASDYQCLDFDEGPFPPSGWTQVITPPGSVTRTTSPFFSSPSSFQSVCPLDEGVEGRATFDWTTTATGSAVRSVSVTAMMNPLTPSFSTGWPDFVDLVCVAFTDQWSFACLSYTYGNTARAWQSSAYSGLFLRFQYTVDDARYVDECPVSGTFSANVWSSTEFRVTTATGNIEAVINGTTSTCVSSIAAPAPSTVPFVWLGSKAGYFGRVPGEGSAGWTTFFDNVVVAVRR